VGELSRRRADRLTKNSGSLHETVEEVGELSRRRADRLTKAGSLHETVEEVGELSRRRADRLTKAGSLHEDVCSLPFKKLLGRKVLSLSALGKRTRSHVGHMRTESKKEKSDVQSCRWINKWAKKKITFGG
jgi:hypothetical protein